MRMTALLPAMKNTVKKRKEMNTTTTRKKTKNITGLIPAMRKRKTRMKKNMAAGTATRMIPIEGGITRTAAIPIAAITMKDAVRATVPTGAAGLPPWTEIRYGGMPAKEDAPRIAEEVPGSGAILRGILPAAVVRALRKEAQIRVAREEIPAMAVALVAAMVVVPAAAMAVSDAMRRDTLPAAAVPALRAGDAAALPDGVRIRASHAMHRGISPAVPAVRAMADGVTPAAQGAGRAFRGLYSFVLTYSAIK
jgi:hypothetical protein